MSGGAGGGGETRVLRPGRLKYVLLALFGLVIVLLGLVLVLAEEWYGWPVFGLVVVVASSCLLMLSPRFAALTLTPEGFILRAGFTRRTWRWEAVSDFFPVYIDRTRAVGFNYADRTTLSEFKTKVGDIRGFDEFLPEVYRMDVDDLATLMNEWRRRGTTGT